jgi:integrase
MVHYNVTNSNNRRSDSMTTGTVRKRGDKWSYIINLPFDPVKGNYPQIRRSGFKGKKEALDALRLALNEIEAGATPVQATTPVLTVEKYMSEWLNSIAGTVAPRTLEIYRYSAELMTPYIGDAVLDKLDHQTIETMYSAFNTKGFAPSSVHRVHRVLRTALNRAVRRGIIATSPINRVDPPKNKIERRSVLDVDQANALLDWLKPTHYITYIAASLALHTGMRRGEISGLTWGDIDFERGIIRITRSRQRKHKQDIVGAPKTAGSIRAIPIDKKLLALLQDWRQQQLIANDTTYVLAHKDGTAIDPNAITATMRKGLKALQLPQVSFHDLRHTHATLLLQANVPLKIVSERLGHASIVMTANTYSHVTENMQEEATRKISDILRRNDS